MVDKRKTKAKIQRLRRIKTWQLLIVLLMLGFVSATFLRLNNIGMIERRDAVLKADKAGDDQALQARLYDLQRYVSAHMNADPGRVALEHKYQRDNDKLKEQFINESSDTNPNGNIYKRAAEVCDPIGQAQGWRWPDARYVTCINQELEKYPAASELKSEFRSLPTAPYYHTFVSPLWSPDFAGWSVLLCLIIIVIIVVRFLILAALYAMLKWRYRRV